jgi:hypothetical protein
MNNVILFHTYLTNIFNLIADGGGAKPFFPFIGMFSIISIYKHLMKENIHD